MAVCIVSAAIIACQPRPAPRILLEYAKAAALYDSGDIAGAVDGANSILERDRRFLPALLLAGKASFFMGDDAAAIAALERGVRAAPRAGEAALWLARAYRASGKNEEARRYCELLLSTDQSNVAALRLASMLAGDSGDIGAAAAFVDSAIAAAAESGMAFADRAALRWASGDGDGTLSDLDAAIAILPTASAAYRAATELRILVMEAEK